MNDLDNNEGLPSVFKTWNQMYVFVLVLHVVLVFAFFLLTKKYS